MKNIELAFRKSNKRLNILFRKVSKDRREQCLILINKKTLSNKTNFFLRKRKGERKMEKSIDYETLIKMLNRQIAYGKEFQEIAHSSEINQAYFDGYLNGLKIIKKRIEKLKK